MNPLKRWLHYHAWLWDNALNFEGRASRKELITMYLYALMLMILPTWFFSFYLGEVYLPIFVSVLMHLSKIMCVFSVSVRRCHDIGYSGIWALSIVLIVPAVVLAIVRGQAKANLYGDRSIQTLPIKK